MYIHYHFRHFSNDHPNPFKTQSTWSPPLPDNPNLLSYIASVAESIQRVFKHNTYNQPSSNLNENEMSFLTNYNIHNQEYVIKPADKGGAIVIWSTTDYEKEALSQLNDNKYYEKIQAQPDMIITAQTNTITNYVKDLFKFGDIDYKTLKYLLPPSPPRIPIFYLLPKIHKPNNPGRPIISGCDSPADRLSSFIDTHLKPLCSSLPSYIKDTNHFLQTIFNITTPLPPNTILATIDVKSLYTNIPHDEGIRATLEALDTKHGCMWPFRKVIHQFLIHILKENYFTFNDQLYLQKHGTAMGTKMAPSFANIFMGTLEEQITSYPSYGKDSLMIYFSSGHMERNHSKHSLHISTQHTPPSNLKSHTPPRVSTSSTPQFMSLHKKHLLPHSTLNPQTACHSYINHHTIQKHAKKA